MIPIPCQEVEAVDPVTRNGTLSCGHQDVRCSTMYGSSPWERRARVGHLYPSGGLCDDEVQLMAPSSVRFLTTRLPFRSTGVEDDLTMAEDLELHAGLLADADVDLIAFNCTAASMLLGPETLRQRITRATSLPVVTTVEAVVDALRRLQAERILLLNPYPRDVEEREIDHLGRLGFSVLDTRGPRCRTPVEQGLIPPEYWLTAALEFDRREADAILLSCAGTRVAEAHHWIEAATGLPLITSNQALLWDVLRTLRIDDPVPRFGRLLMAGRSGTEETA